MGSILRNKTFGVETSCLQSLYALIDAVRILLGAAALKDELHLLRVLDVLGGVSATTQQTVVAEYLGTTQGNEFCLNTTR